MDPNLLQQIRDSILGITLASEKRGGLHTSIYLQEVRDAILSVTGGVFGNLNEAIYLQQIRDAVLGVTAAPGTYGSLNSAIYLQQIRDAYLSVASNPMGGLDEDIYLGEILPIATGGGGMRSGNGLVAFGDSIALASGTHPTDRGIYDWFNALLGWKFNLVYNAGVGGNGTTQMLARIQADVIAKNAAWCLVIGGGNDIAAGTAAATTISNLQAIYNQLHNAGINVIATTITPTTSMNTEAEGTAWTTINQAIRDFATANSWVYLADIGPEYHDTSQPTLAVPLTGYTADGTHPNSLGAGTCGKKAHTDLAARLAGVSNYCQLVTDANDPSIIVTSVYSHPYNALMTGTAGGKTAPAVGTVADEWTVSIGGTWSKVARSDGKPGVWQQVLVNNEAQATFNAFDTTTGFSVGDTVWAEVEIETDETWTNIKSIPLTLTFLQTSTVLANAYGLSWSAGGGSGTACINPRSAVLMTPKTVVPANCNKLRFNFVIFAETAGTCTLRLSRMCIRKQV